MSQRWSAIFCAMSAWGLIYSQKTLNLFRKSIAMSRKTPYSHWVNDFLRKKFQTKRLTQRENFCECYQTEFIQFGFLMSRASVQGIDATLRSIIFKKVIISSLENDWPKNLYEIFRCLQMSVDFNLLFFLTNLINFQFRLVFFIQNQVLKFFLSLENYSILLFFKLSHAGSFHLFILSY